MSTKKEPEIISVNSLNIAELKPFEIARKINIGTSKKASAKDVKNITYIYLGYDDFAERHWVLSDEKGYMILNLSEAKTGSADDRNKKYQVIKVATPIFPKDSPNDWTKLTFEKLGDSEDDEEGYKVGLELYKRLMDSYSKDTNHLFRKNTKDYPSGPEKIRKTRDMNVEFFIKLTIKKNHEGA